MHVHSLYVKYEISANLKLRTLWEINTDQTTILNGADMRRQKMNW